jgi:hypothetical protein
MIPISSKVLWPDVGHPIMGGHDIRQHLVQARHSNGHLIRLGLPQPRRALDVGRQQRHRFQSAAPVSFAHASQHAVTRIAEHQQNR